MKLIFNHTMKLALALMMLTHSLYAQDPHFTQFYRIPTYYNPASSGQDVEHIRLTMLYRNQWASVTSPFVTQSLFFDKQVSKVGLGATLINNTSGDAGFRQFYINGTLSYRTSFRNHQFAGGVQLGLIQKSFDPSKMTFDDQYNPDQGYNSSNPTNESFSYTKLTRPDFGLGFLWTYGQKKSNSYHPYFGMSFQHINQSKETFIETTNIIPRKIVVQGGVGIHVNDQLDLIPMFMYQQQQFAKEMMYGVVAKLPLEERNHFDVGVFHRKKDAVSAYVGYQFNSCMLGASYDVNISGVTGGQGAFELTLTYIPKAKVKSTPKTKKEGEEKDIKTTNKKPVVKILHDRDADGIEDKKDKCPNIAGVASMQGCPVKAKKVVTASGKPTTTSKPIVKIDTTHVAKPIVTPVPVKVVTPVKISDSDNDGLNDELDACPNVAGELSLKGCPVQIEKILPNKSHTIAEQTNKVNPVKVKALPISTIPIVITEPVIILDSDKDGILDNIDECPNVPGITSLKGCPVKIQKIIPNNSHVIAEHKISSAPVKIKIPIINITPVVITEPEVILDSDKDGILDNVDECPHVQGIISLKGCPVKIQKIIPNNSPVIGEHKIKATPIKVKIPLINLTPIVITEPKVILDSDNDGVLDDVDECPYIKGTALTHGCPDTDQDGIIDANDPCPFVAGKKGGNGCPEIELTTPVFIKEKNIEFMTNSTDVKGIYKLDVIEPALDSIYFNDDYKLVITGHTDGEGDASFNMNLSQARADKVKAIFLKKGLSEDRIQTIAYGETMPIANNNDEFGRAHNRRVEIHVVKIIKQ